MIYLEDSLSLESNLDPECRSTADLLSPGWLAVGVCGCPVASIPAHGRHLTHLLMNGWMSEPNLGSPITYQLFTWYPYFYY
jgi:hypothetical protein